MSTTTMTAKDVLMAAKALIDIPEKWTQYQTEDPDTGARCALSAVYAVDDSRDVIYWLHAAIPRRFVSQAINCGHITDRERITEYNDCRTHRGVMAWFNRAIEAAES